MSLAVSVASLEPHEKAGWLTKQGGSIKTWKHRWGVLQGDTLWYFKSKTDTEATGFIILGQKSYVHDESKKRKNMISVFGRGYKRPRVFFIYFESPEETQSWSEALKKGAAIGAAREFDGLPHAKPQQRATVAVSQSTGAEMEVSHVRAKMSTAKNSVPYLVKESNTVSQCWKLWSEALLPKSSIPVGEELRFKTVANASFSLTEWGMNGPQTAVVQRIVDFFWAVGAPSHQIDLLNSVGSALNPERLGFWTRLSSNGGMDAGWSFSEKMPVDTVMNTLKKNEALTAVAEWATACGVTVCREVAHDVSGVPPQTYELRFDLPGTDAAAQVAVVQDTMKRFSMPEIPEEQLALFRVLPTTEKHPLQIILAMTDTTIARVSLFMLNPSLDMVKSLMQFAQGNQETYDAFTSAIEGPIPHNLLLSYSMPGVSHTMYKDGFDVMFGWDVGSEKMDS